MVELTRIVALLQEQRRALIEQLEAVDRAIAALDSAGEAPEEEAVAPRHVKAKRTQTDSHKHAIAIGKRRARNARDAAKGLMREVQDDGFVPAVGSRLQGDAPRLVKRPPRKIE